MGAVAQTDYTGDFVTRLAATQARFVRVLENLESPGILFWLFPGLENPGKRPLVLEIPGNLLKGLGHAILGNFSTDQMVIELTKI